MYSSLHTAFTCQAILVDFQSRERRQVAQPSRYRSCTDESTRDKLEVCFTTIQGDLGLVVRR